MHLLWFFFTHLNQNRQWGQWLLVEFLLQHMLCDHLLLFQHSTCRHMRSEQRFRWPCQAPPLPSPSPDNLDEPDNFNHRSDPRLITALLSAGASAPRGRAAAQPRQGQSGFTSPSAPTNSSWKQLTAPPLPSDRSDRLHLLTFIKNVCVFCSADSFDLIFKSPLLAAVHAGGRVMAKMKDFLQELHRSHTSCVALELKLEKSN